MARKRTKEAAQEKGNRGPVSPPRFTQKRKSQAEWLQRWQDLNANGGDWDPPPDGRRWHRIQAAEAEAAEQWFAAVFHLKWLLGKDPHDVDLQRRLQTAKERLTPARP